MENNQHQYYDANNPFESRKKRPGFLTFLCVLTFIGSGLSVLSYLAWAFMGNTMASMQMPFQMEEMQDLLDKMTAVSSWKYALISVLYLLSIVGAVFMIYMKKIGFHIYAGVQILILFLPTFLITNQFAPDIASLILTVLFLIGYGAFYKMMSWNLSDEPEIESHNDEQ